MKKYIKSLILPSIMILLPILAGLFLWDRLPEQVPMHWNASGQVDGWGSKGFFVFAMPLIMLAMEWLAVLVTHSDPKKKAHSQKVLSLVIWIVPTLQLVLSGVTYATALGTAVPIEVVMPLMMGVLFIAIGNYMPKCKQNYTIGIKISWTLNSEENWNKTHRFAGRVWVIGGFAMLPLSFVGSVWVILGGALSITLIPLIYSYILYRKGI